MMSTPNKSDAEMLSALIDADLRALLEADPAEIADEAAEIYGSAAQAAIELRAVINGAIEQSGKLRLAAARQLIDAARGGGGSIGQVIQWPLDQKKKLLARLRAAKPGVTMAARQGEDETENDIDGTLEDLIELGLIDEQGNFI